MNCSLCNKTGLVLCKLCGGTNHFVVGTQYVQNVNPYPGQDQYNDAYYMQNPGQYEDVTTVCDITCNGTHKVKCECVKNVDGVISDTNGQILKIPIEILFHICGYIDTSDTRLNMWKAMSPVIRTCTYDEIIRIHSTFSQNDKIPQWMSLGVVCRDKFHIRDVIYSNGKICNAVETRDINNHNKNIDKRKLLFRLSKVISVLIFLFLMVTTTSSIIAFMILLFTIGISIWYVTMSLGIFILIALVLFIPTVFIMVGDSPNENYIKTLTVERFKINNL